MLSPSHVLVITSIPVYLVIYFVIYLVIFKLTSYWQLFTKDYSMTQSVIQRWILKLTPTYLTRRSIFFKKRLQFNNYLHQYYYQSIQLIIFIFCPLGLFTLDIHKVLPENAFIFQAFRHLLLCFHVYMNIYFKIQGQMKQLTITKLHHQLFGDWEQYLVKSLEGLKSVGLYIR